MYPVFLEKGLNSLCEWLKLRVEEVTILVGMRFCIRDADAFLRNDSIVGIGSKSKERPVMKENVLG